MYIKDTLVKHEKLFSESRSLGGLEFKKQLFGG